MDGVNQVAVPAGVLLFLTWAFDYGKLLLANVPGFRQSDEDHAKHLQLVFFALCFLVIGGYSYVSGMHAGGHPADLNGWINWIIGIGQTAVAMAFGGALVYSKISMNGGKSSTASESADASATPNGLSLESAIDPSQMGA